MRRAFFLNKIPLRYLIPALLTVFAAVIFLYTLQVYVPIVNSQLERDELEEITQELAFLQRHFERELLKGEVEEVQQEVSSIGANPSREFALLLDENDLVIAATRISWVGQKVDEILPGVIDRNEFGKARDNYQGSMVFSDDREKLTGYYPVGLGAAENELRPSRVGILLMRHDLSPEKAVLKRNVERHLFQIFLILGVIALIIWLILHVSLTKPIKALTQAASRLASGDLDARTGFSGENEIDAIGKAFDVMAERIGQTQRSLAEASERLREAQEIARLGSFEFIPDSGKLIISGELRSILGLSFEGPVTVESFIGLVHRDDRELAETFFSSGMSEGFDLRIERSGACKTVHVKARRDRGAGPGMHVLGTMQDISERTTSEEEARRMHSQLIQANKMSSIGTLASGIAHEINNPNNFIIFNSSLIADSWKDCMEVLENRYREHGEFTLGGLPYSEMKELMPDLLNGVIEGSRRIKGIVQDLKDFSRVDRTGLDGSFEVNRAVLSSCSILRNQIDRYTEKFEVRCSDGLPQVKGSLQKIEQVIINLIMNALQALPDKSRGVVVETALKGDGVLISVMDEGAGMGRDVMDRITEPFFTTKLGSGGTGLGLSISYNIIKKHGGTLEFASEPGKGTMAIVKLPPAELAVSGGNG